MLRRLIALFFIFAFSHTYAAPQNQMAQLNQAFDNINYTLSVEWDQQDQNFLDNELNKFEREIEKLQNQGLDNKDLFNVVVSKIKNQKVASDVENLFNVVKAENLSNEEAREMVLEQLSETHSDGANWTGRRLKVRLGLILIFVTALILIYKNHHDDDDSSTTDDGDHEDHDGQCGGGGHDGGGQHTGGGDGGGHCGGGDGDHEDGDHEDHDLAYV